MSSKKTTNRVMPDKAHLSFLLNNEENEHYDNKIDMSMSSVTMHDHSARRDSNASSLHSRSQGRSTTAHDPTVYNSPEQLYSSVNHSREGLLTPTNASYNRYSNSAIAPNTSHSSTSTQTNPMDIADIVMADPNAANSNSKTAERGVRKKRQRKFICDKCGFGFYTNSDLQKHISSVHLLLRPYQCTLCDKKFGERSNATKHFKSVHERQKNAECEICHKVFAFRDGLVRHVRLVHDNIRNFHCKYPGCGQSFKQSAHLKKHQQIHAKGRHASNSAPGVTNSAGVNAQRGQVVS